MDHYSHCYVCGCVLTPKTAKLVTITIPPLLSYSEGYYKEERDYCEKCYLRHCEGLDQVDKF